MEGPRLQKPSHQLWFGFLSPKITKSPRLGPQAWALNPSSTSVMHMSCSLNSQKGVIWWKRNIGDYFGGMKGDTRSLDYSSHELQGRSFMMGFSLGHLGCSSILAHFAKGFRGGHTRIWVVGSWMDCKGMSGRSRFGAWGFKPLTLHLLQGPCPADLCAYAETQIRKGASAMCNSICWCFMALNPVLHFDIKEALRSLRSLNPQATRSLDANAHVDRSRQPKSCTPCR